MKWRKAEPSQRKGEEAVSIGSRHGKGMNYHNFISRLSIRRAPTANTMRETPKVVRKKTPRAARRRSVGAVATAAAVWLSLAVLMPHSALAVSAADDTMTTAHPVWMINAPTLIVTVAGVAVALWRIPVLWRRDLAC
jgi:hypothetical protein